MAAMVATCSCSCSIGAPPLVHDPPAPDAPTTLRVCVWGAILALIRVPPLPLPLPLLQPAPPPIERQPRRAVRQVAVAVTSCSARSAAAVWVSARGAAAAGHRSRRIESLIPGSISRRGSVRARGTAAPCSCSSSSPSRGAAGGCARSDIVQVATLSVLLQGRGRSGRRVLPTKGCHKRRTRMKGGREEERKGGREEEVRQT